ncbi:MAG: bacillithiol biosynthesis BshC [Bacteroidetes bacterium]|nr:bacillithiol biosynthesis BshC [Bacteroidota bacterium]
MKSEIDNHPEKFSPNVLLRPVYQETILPNLAYIGGPAEVHYWLQLKNLFNHFNVPYPMVVLRNCFMLLEEDVLKKLDKYKINQGDIFESTDKLINDYIKAHTDSEISLSDLSGKLDVLFNDIAVKASSVDVTLKNTVEAEKQKALNALKNIESKMLKSEKQKQEAVVNQVKKIKDKLFPSNSLQERYDNVFPYFVKYGTAFIDKIYTACDPLPTDFKLVSISA